MIIIIAIIIIAFINIIVIIIIIIIIIIFIIIIIIVIIVIINIIIIDHYLLGKSPLLDPLNLNPFHPAKKGGFFWGWGSFLANFLLRAQK